MLSARRSILYQIAAYFFALLALVCALHWVVGGYVAMQRGADLKMTMNQLLPGPNGGTATVVVRVVPEDLASGAHGFEAYAPGTGHILIARVGIPDQPKAPLQSWSTASDGTALVEMTVERDGETGQLVLTEAGMIPQMPGWPGLASIGLSAAIINGAITVMFVLLMLKAPRKPVDREPQRMPRLRSARSLRTAQRFASLEAQDRLNDAPRKA